MPRRDRYQAWLDRPSVAACAAAVLGLLLAVVVGCSSIPGIASRGVPGSVGDRPVEMPAAGRPALEEEVWVIVRGPRAAADEERPGAGAMVAEVDRRRVAVPLKSTAVEATVQANVARVKVTQEFHNPFDRLIDASYLFPLPEDAAVREFVMTIGARRVRGIVRERAEAERLYEQARRNGHAAALLAEERPNVFSQRVANLEPGKSIAVTMTYFHAVPVHDGWYEWVFPMVVAPRFHGGGAPGDALASGVVLGEGVETSHRVSLEVALDVGVPVAELSCGTHRVVEAAAVGGVRRVRLDAGDGVPNRDFVLRYRVGGDRPLAGGFAHGDDGGSYFTLLLAPPRDLLAAPRVPLEVIFVIDCSGSMRGPALAQAVDAVRRGIELLTPADTFQVIQFADGASVLGESATPATAEGVARAMRFLEDYRCAGGTDIERGVEVALGLPHDSGRRRVVAFMTDGRVTNESDVLRAIERGRGEARVFSFGLGGAPNRYLLSRMAKFGRGAVAYIGYADDAPAAMEAFLQRVTRPVLTDLAIDLGPGVAVELASPTIPDLHHGRPVVVVGRIKGVPPASARITGRSAGRELSFEAPLARSGSKDASALPAVWARARIAEYCDRAMVEESRRGELAQRVRELALKHGLVSAYTSFVAVDALLRVNREGAMVVPVPLHMPAQGPGDMQGAGAMSRALGRDTP